MSDTGTEASYVFGPFRLQPDKRQLQDANGRNVVLRAKVFDLLWYLLQNRGRLVSKAELLEALWPGIVVEENNLNQAVSALRQALSDDAKTPAYIVTVKGRGYQFVGDLSREPESGDNNTVPAARVARHGPVLLAIAIIAIAAMVWMDQRHYSPVVIGSAVIEHFAEITPSLATDYSGSHAEPTLAPDGRMMAYVSNASGMPQIWVKNLQRGDPLQLTDEPFPASTPSWSPGDDQILFVQHSPDGSSIKSVGTLGSPVPTTVVEHATAPNWSRRANAFVFSRGHEVWIGRNDGRDIEKIVGIPVSQGFAAREPALSPDGKLVVFVHADVGPLGNLWLIPSAGGEARQLTGRAAHGGITSAPEWSSDGKYIVYSVEADMSGGQLWRIDVESGEAAALTTGAGGASDAALSSDGTRLAYTATRTLWQLTRVDPQTAETSGIHASRTPVLLPVASGDGKRIVFFTRNATGMQLVTIGSDGDNLRQLTFDEGGENILPTWSGDGESILYYRGRSLHRLNPLDGSDTEVFADFDWSSHIWLAAHGDRLTYHVVDRPTGLRRTVVRETGESAEVDLPVPIEAAKWSPDGKSLAGWFRRTGELLICDPRRAACANIEQDGENVIGSYPMWSIDGQQLYYLRTMGARDCCTVWRIDLDGTNRQRIAELRNFDPANSYYGIDADGAIFYNHLDRSSDEIWIVDSASALTSTGVNAGPVDN